METSLWAAGEAYEPYIGRWSRLVAPEFIRWLAPPPESDWLDVGCGTGELSRVILAIASPRSVRGIDPSEGFIRYAGTTTRDSRATFSLGDAQHLPAEDHSADVVVSGLVLNFVPDAAAAVAEFRRVVRPGGTVASYVWDYAGEMQMLRYFWDAAADLNPAAREHDEARFTICTRDALASTFSTVLREVETRRIDVPTVFSDFTDYWTPFLAGGAPAPRYAMALGDRERDELRDLIRERLPVARDGSISLIARALAVKGVR